MRRREFLGVLGGAAAWPLTAHAQQGERVRRIGIIMGAGGEEPENKARIAAFLQELQSLGWIDGRNARIDVRAAAGNVSTAKKNRNRFGRSCT